MSDLSLCRDKPGAVKNEEKREAKRKEFEEAGREEGKKGTQQPLGTSLCRDKPRSADRPNAPQ